MFDFFVKKIRLIDLTEGFCDVHSHLLWGVDDGSSDQNETDRLASKLSSIGFEKIYLTPHIIYGLYGDQCEKSLRSRFAELKPSPNIEYRLGAEYFLDEKFISHFHSDEPMLTMGGEWLLTEYALSAQRADRLDELFEVSLSGKSIIIAHPERYAFTLNDPSRCELDKLLSRNFALQLNLLSLVGYYGPRIKAVSIEMLRKGDYTFVGSDTHSVVYTEKILGSEVPASLAEPLRRLVENNQRILWK